MLDVSSDNYALMWFVNHSSRQRLCKPCLYDGRDIFHVVACVRVHLGF